MTDTARTLSPDEPLPFSERDVVIIGGGQAALATGYYLARDLKGTAATVAILDDQAAPGGSWRTGWDSLRLFSPAEWSSLPGYLFPRHLGERGAASAETPHRDDVIGYLRAYEGRYDLPVWRPVRVTGIHRAGREPSKGDMQSELRVATDRGHVGARAVIAATGTASSPYVPDVPGCATFRGTQVHSSSYRSPEPFVGKRVLVVGGGNSGAQIMAEVSAVADASWVAEREPRFLPPGVDGRALFDAATAQYHALQAGVTRKRPYGLGGVVQVAPVREAKEAGRLDEIRPPVARFTANGVVWPDHTAETVDAVIWCTGFRPALGFAEPLGIVGPDSHVAVEGTRSVAEPRLWFAGYGSWTGFASATLVGVGRSARDTAREVAQTITGAGDTGKT